MKKLIKNIILFFVAIILLLILGSFGMVYTIISSIYNFKNLSVLKYWSDIVYTINVGIDKIGNVLLGDFMNKFAVYEPVYKFGNINDTISKALAKNLNNLTSLGKFIVSILEWIDPGHMEDSLK
jgi:hypothetical protein